MQAQTLNGESKSFLSQRNDLSHQTEKWISDERKETGLLLDRNSATTQTETVLLHSPWGKCSREVEDFLQAAQTEAKSNSQLKKAN